MLKLSFVTKNVAMSKACLGVKISAPESHHQAWHNSYMVTSSAVVFDASNL